MALPEPTSLTEGLWYLPAPVNTFIIEGSAGTSILVDTGQDKTYARRLLRTSQDVLNLEPAAIINTHAHSDHFGGNSWLLRRLPDARVYAPAGAATVIREPVLQPLGLWQGATPLPELLKKWTHGKPSRVDTELGPGTLEVAGVPLTFIDAAGHARQQLAVQYRDVLIAADGFAGLELLEKYPLTFSHDPGLMLESFERLGQSGARLAVPGHGSPGLPAELAAANRDAAERVAAAIISALEERPLTLDELVPALLGQLGMSVTDVVRYQLNASTTAAWLGWLRAGEQVWGGVQDDRLLWSARQLPY